MIADKCSRDFEAFGYDPDKCPLPIFEDFEQCLNWNVWGKMDEPQESATRTEPRRKRGRPLARNKAEKKVEETAPILPVQETKSMKKRQKLKKLNEKSIKKKQKIESKRGSRRDLRRESRKEKQAICRDRLMSIEDQSNETSSDGIESKSFDGLKM